ncbi:MAG: FAD-dependent oxidoreductase [Gemmatimonadaceae bacterium]
MSSSELPDVVVVGDGLIGLCIARSIARSGVSVQIIGARRPGFASSAAAGLLAPTIDPAHGPAFDFAIAARDRYRSFVTELEEETKINIPLHLEGILRVPFDDSQIASLRADEGSYAHWISAPEVGDLESKLSAPLGALFHHGDGTVDNGMLLDALDRTLTSLRVHRRVTEVVAVNPAKSHHASVSSVELADGSHVECGTVVLAPGAWLSLIRSLPRRLPVTPLRGQMLSLSGVPIHRPVYAPGGYLAPRLERGFTIAGSTSESAGFNVGVTTAAIEKFAAVAQRLLPTFRIVAGTSWSGLRPMTPDGLPIIGADPDFPALLYACGHSRNGVLMAPLTADVLTATIMNRSTTADISPFAVSRFQHQATEYSEKY